MFRYGSLCLLAFQLVLSQGWGTGLVESSESNNEGLLVGVSHGLPGIGIDISNVEKMAQHESYKYGTTVLRDYQANVADIERELTDVSSKVEESGTFFFYFTGHGNIGTLTAQDESIEVSQIRKALEAGRQEQGPLERFVMIIDSCHSGSLIDPIHGGMLRIVRHFSARQLSELFADKLFDEMNSGAERGEQFWKKIFILTSARADQTCLAGGDGSVFTNAMKRSFQETEQSNENVNHFIKLAQKYTYWSNPVARLDPVALGEEALVN